MPVIEPMYGWDVSKCKFGHPQFQYEIEEDKIAWRHDCSCQYFGKDDCSHSDCHSDCHTMVYGRETAYAGAVLYEWERNGYSDSDWFVTVYDVVEDVVKSYEYKTTRAACYGYWAKIDATPEIIVQALESMAPIIEAGWHKENVRQCNDVKIGREVKVLGGRKYKDKVGVVRWIGKNPHHYTKYDDRVRIETAEGESFFMDLDRVEIVDSERYLGGDVDLQDHLATARSNMIYKWGKPTESAMVIIADPLEMEVSF